MSSRVTEMQRLVLKDSALFTSLAKNSDVAIRQMWELFYPVVVARVYVTRGIPLSPHQHAMFSLIQSEGGCKPNEISSYLGLDAAFVELELERFLQTSTLLSTDGTYYFAEATSHGGAAREQRFLSKVKEETSFRFDGVSGAALESSWYQQRLLFRPEERGQTIHGSALPNLQKMKELHCSDLKTRERFELGEEYLAVEELHAESALHVKTYLLYTAEGFHWLFEDGSVIGALPDAITADLSAFGIGLFGEDSLSVLKSECEAVGLQPDKVTIKKQAFPHVTLEFDRPISWLGQRKFLWFKRSAIIAKVNCRSAD